MNKRLLVSTLVAILLITSPAHAERSEKVRVGAILPLTGEVKWFGEACVDGLRLAEQEVQSPILELRIEDDRSVDNVATLKAAQKLLVENVQVLLLTAVTSVRAVAEVVPRHALPALVLMDHVPVGTGRWFRGFGYSTAHVGSDMADHIVASGNGDRVAVVSAHDEWSEQVSGAFVEQLKSHGRIVALHETVSLDESDFRSLLTRIRAANVSSIYFPLYKSSLVSFVKQARQAGVTKALFTGEELSPAEIAELGVSANGIVATAQWLADSEFADKYTRHSGKSPDPVSLAQSGLCYDAYRFLDAAVRASQESGRSIHQELDDTRWSGILAPIHFGGSQNISRRQPLLVVQDGVFSPLTKPDVQR